MPTVLQICVEVNKGSVGRIAEQIGESVIKNNWMSYIAYARPSNESTSETIKIGSNYDVYLHGLESRLFDNHCFSSRSATREFVKEIEILKPDIIHLHHLHGYYINIRILFEYLSSINIPIVWTFHDCWSFTGHCAYFDYVGCEKWKTMCFDCEQRAEYPRSILIDKSYENYIEKRRLFNSVSSMHIVSVSKWLDNIVGESFLSTVNRSVICNGIDLNRFYPRSNREDVRNMFGAQGKFIILGVASTWDKRKGLVDFLKIYDLLDTEKYVILLVGLSDKQIEKLPKGIIAIRRTENVDHLAEIYSASDVFVNPTYEDTYPTTNLESIACGTPVITYNTGGSVESVTTETGMIVEKGDLYGLVDAIHVIYDKGHGYYRNSCHSYAIQNFNCSDAYQSYMILYKNLLNINYS